PKNEKRQERQRRDRRGQTLIKKAYEISQLSNADVFLGIRFRDTGKMKTFCADSTGVWSLYVLQLDSFYPIPEKKTPNDF
ncbi:hypothetical protein BGW36DRAFT_260076, partial [Talaromyces proteolyticus]